jgi:integrase/recombinase XerD
MSGLPTDRSKLLQHSQTPLAQALRRYLHSLALQHLSAINLRARRSQLARFYAWCDEHALNDPAVITHAHLVAFQTHLFTARKPDGRPYALNGQRCVLDHVQSFFRWLVRHREVPSNPAADLDLPKKIALHLREPLNVSEIESVFALPDLATPYGLRDRTMLEVFYATGIRRQELANLCVHDIDPERGTLMVRQGKGKKDRLLPLGERALAWIGKYRREARDELLNGAVQERLFINYQGAPLSAYALSWRIRRYFDQAGITKLGACHLFRHTMASAMLDNGADVRHVQEMLGHSLIVTTQRYTHVSIARLKAVHAATHPAARLLREMDAPLHEDAHEN